MSTLFQYNSDKTKRFQSDLTVSGVLFFLLFSTAAWGQTARFTPDSNAAANLWRIDAGTELYVGASFYYLNPADSIVVWMDTSDADITGNLYFMVPGYRDSAFFLLTNKQHTRINVTASLGIAIPPQTEIFFMYRLQSDSATPRYTGQNRSGVDPGNQIVYPGARFVSRDFGVRPGYGHRWAVAGRLRNGNSAVNDTVVFGFEDGNTKIDPLHDSLVTSDFDFNDVIFRVTGVSLNVEAHPDSIALQVSNTAPTAGDTVRCTAVIWADSAGIMVRVSRYDSLLRWQLTGSAVNGDTLIVSPLDDTTAFFIGRTSTTPFTVRTWFISPFSGDTVMANRVVRVKPGPARQLSIELRADTGSTGFSRNRPAPAGRIQIASNQSSRSVYAILRDAFGNFTLFGSLAVWDTLTISARPGMVAGIATVRSGDVRLGEGVITKATGNGDIMVLARHAAGIDTLRDTLLVNVAGASFDSLRLLAKRAADSMPIQALRISTDQCTTLVAQARRTDNGAWENVPVSWVFSAPWNAADAPTPKGSVDFCPGDTGNGIISISYGNHLYYTITLNAIPGAPVRLILYHDSLALPADTSVRAGRTFSCIARLFDHHDVWLSDTMLVAGSNALSWKIVENVALIDNRDSTGNVTLERDFSMNYLPLKAYRSVVITVARGDLRDSVTLAILPGPAYRLVIEPTGDWTLSPNTPNPVDTVEIPDDRTSARLYAIVRDSLGNYVDSLRQGSWGSIDTIVSVVAGTSPCEGVIVKNLAVSQGKTVVYATEKPGEFADSAWVKLLPYHYTKVRIVTGNGAAIDSLTCSTNDDTVLIVQAMRSDTSLWREVNGSWSAAGGIMLLPVPPAAAARYAFSALVPACGSIAVTLGTPLLSDTLQVCFSRGKPLWASLHLLTPPEKIIAGDTIKALASIYGRHGLVPGRYCYTTDSSFGPAYYLDSLGDGNRADKPSAISGSLSAFVAVPENIGDGINQCFINGLDTVRFLLYYAPASPDSLHRLKVLLGGLSAATPLFKLFPGPLSSIALKHNRGDSGTDTLVLRAPRDSALITAIGYDRYVNFRGEESCLWSVSGTLHTLDSAGPFPRIIYSADSSHVSKNESGNINARVIADTLINGSLAVRIIGPLARPVSAITRDTNANGLLDRIEMSFSLPVTIGGQSTLAQSISVTCNGTILNVNGVTAGPTINDLIVLLKESAVPQPQTGWKPLVAVNNSRFPLSGAMDSFRITCDDGAGPVVWSAVKQIADLDDRKQDRVIVTFSEPVRGPDGNSFSLQTPPKEVFTIWVEEKAAFTRVEMLDGIDYLSSAPSPDQLTFIMKNGKDLTPQNHINIRTNSGVLLVDASAANPPLADNKKVKVEVKGSGTGDLEAFPNPTIPTAHREKPGTFNLRCNPSAVDWVRNDNAGVILYFKLALPDEDGVSVGGRLTIHDVLGNRVAADPVSYYKPEKLLKGERVLQNSMRPNIISSNWIADGSVYDYYIYWNGFTINGFRAAPGVYRAVLVLVITSSKGKDVRVLAKKIGIYQ
jgi:hypothetical protein